MTVKPIELAPGNKTTTKLLLKGVTTATTYLEVEEKISDLMDLYNRVCELFDNTPMMDYAFPLWGTKTHGGYYISVTEECAVKWNGRIYTEGEILGIARR